jgi:hypothetical protein
MTKKEVIKMNMDIPQKMIFYPLQAKPSEDIGVGRSEKYKFLREEPTFYPLDAKREEKSPPIIKFINQ